MTAQGRNNRFRYTADIERVPDGTDPTARESVVDCLACSAVYPMDGRERERAGMATVTKAYRAYTAVPVETITTQHRFVIDGEDYRIHEVIKHPENNPQFIELYLEAE